MLVPDLRTASLFMTSEIEIRAYRPGDEHGIVDLFGRCFGREISLAHWQWKMQSFKPDYENIWVAACGDRLAGHYAGLPFDAWINGQRANAIAGTDAMVEPEMRRQGILTRMANTAHDNWRRAGVRVAVSLPNEQWGSRTAAVDWMPLFPFRWLLRILRPESVLARRLNIDSLARMEFVGAASRRLLGRARADPGVTVEEIRASHPGFDRIAENTQRLATVHRCRGSDWIERRYLSCPSADYHVLLATRGEIPVGYAVYRLDKLEVVRATIAEIVTSDEAAYVTLVAGIERRCMNARAETIRALAVAGTANFRNFRDCGFILRRAAFALHFIPFDLEMQGLMDARNWHFEGGDFDVV